MIAFMLALALGSLGDDPANVAQCVADNAKVDVYALLATVPGSPEEARVSKRLLPLFAACDDNKTKAHGTIVWRDRAEVANAVMLNKIADGLGDASRASPAATNWRVSISATAVAGRDYSASDLGMRMLGDCVVAAQPEAALRLLRSGVGSAEENAAIAALAPALGPCVASGQNLRVKRQDLRLVVAEPLYHLIVR